MTQAPTSVWNEVRFTSDGISISLFSESPDGGAILEDEMWFTYDELQEMAPSEPKSLRLTSESREALSENVVPNLASQEFGQSGSQESVENLPQVGDIVLDGNPPSWSQDDRLEVVGISDKSAVEYEVDGGPLTVDDINYDSHPDETVIECVYRTDINPDGTYDESNVYAFPQSRIEKILSQKEWHDEYGN